MRSPDCYNTTRVKYAYFWFLLNKWVSQLLEWFYYDKELNVEVMK